MYRDTYIRGVVRDPFSALFQRRGPRSGAIGRRPQRTAFVSGFAAECRDPGLLRDVAGLLTADLAPDAPRIGAMLRVLADVDEAADKAAALARVDPDMATAIRRLRDLPDPPPPALRPKAARGRKPPRVKGSK